MLVVMEAEARAEDIEHVAKRARGLGLRTHVSAQGSQTLIGLLGDVHGLPSEVFAGLRGVEKIQRSEQPFRLASRDFRETDTVIDVAGCEVGGDRVVTMAGPCSVESADQIMETARAVEKAGAQMLRGGAFKPRTSPYSWQGLAEEGLEILAAAREETGLRIVTEVMSAEQVELVSRYADVLQIGTRNMQNFALLHAVGEAKMPVLLKRGMMSTLKEFLLSAEYILSHGNPDVMLCERGIRTFETYTRNTLDINAVPLLKELSHLPVIVDPSHATGKSSLVTMVSKGALAAGADGLIVEVHVDPENAWSDGYQTIDVPEFERLMQDARRVALAVDRSM